MLSAPVMSLTPSYWCGQRNLHSALQFLQFYMRFPQKSNLIPSITKLFKVKSCLMLRQSVDFPLEADQRNFPISQKLNATLVSLSLNTELKNLIDQTLLTVVLIRLCFLKPKGQEVKQVSFRQVQLEAL